MSEAPLAEVSSENKSLSESEQFWLGHYRRWQQSELSIAAYARSQGLVANSFYGWHRRLKLRGLIQPEPTPTVFRRVMVKSVEAPAGKKDILSRTATIRDVELPPVDGKGFLSLRFKLPNGIDGELAGLNPGTCAAFLESLLKLRP